MATVDTPGDETAGQARCGCSWNDQSYHDRLAGIEQLPAAEALVLVAELAQDELNWISDEAVFEWSEWEAFGAAHNWTDPILVADAFSRLANLAERWQKVSPDGPSVRAGLRMLGRVDQLEQEVKDLRDSVRFVPGADIVGCGCPSCQVLLPLLIAGERLAAAEMEETLRLDHSWDDDLLGEPDGAIEAEWQILWDRIRRASSDGNLATDVDNNRGSKLCDGTRQGARYGAAVLVRQLRRRYEMASLRLES